MMLSTPDATASSTPYWMIGLSTSGSISLGCALVAGRKRVPNPAAGNTALQTFISRTRFPIRASQQMISGFRKDKRLWMQTCRVHAAPTSYHRVELEGCAMIRPGCGCASREKHGDPDGGPFTCLQMEESLRHRRCHDQFVGGPVLAEYSADFFHS